MNENFDKLEYLQDKKTNQSLIIDEMGERDDVGVLYDPKVKKQGVKKIILDQANQSNYLTNDYLKQQKIKNRQMGDLSNDYAISQFAPSTWATVMGYIFGVLFSIALLIGLLVGVAYFVGIRGVAVMDDTSQDIVPQGSLAITQLNPSIYDLGTSDIISCTYLGEHIFASIVSVEELAGTINIGRVSEDSDDRYITIDAVDAKVTIVINGLGGFYSFCSANWYFLVGGYVIILIALLVTKRVINVKHKAKELSRCIALKNEYEKLKAERLAREQAELEEMEFEALMRK